VNKTILMGRLGRDPELKQARAGGSVLSISVATKDREKKGEQWEDVTDWHEVVLFGRQAEYLADKARKGDRVLVEGKSKVRKWVGKDGQEKQRSEVVAFSVELLSSGHSEQAGHSGGQSGGPDGGMPF
jgi:single-strand DNA-binding protein